MKLTVLQKLTALIIPLLGLNIAFSQTLALPKTDAPNFTLEGGVTYMKATLDGDLNLNFYGATVAFGWRIDQNHKVQIETGYLRASEKEDFYEPGYGTISIDADFNTLPLLLSYVFCLPLDSEGQWEVNLSPIAGFFWIKSDMDLNDAGYRFSESDSDTSFAFGASAGITYHISKNVYISAKYRFLRMSSATFTYENAGYMLETGDINTHSGIISVGWKF